jgi:hypothetical protein
MYAATPEADNDPVNSNPMELFGVRGAHIVDNADVDTAWRTTTGRPDVTIAVLDSGIKWNDGGGMQDLRLKTRLWKPELPRPRHTRSSALEPGVSCAGYRNAYDANRDGVFNVLDYACDPRVQRDPARRGGLGVGPADMLDPQDVLIAFSDRADRDRNGFVDDIVGWDFVDNDNDPFDDVQYGHGTGEARDSSAEANNGGDLGTCPNCMVTHMRVGDSFIADVNRFAQAVIYAANNDALVVQEALGTLNHSGLGRKAIDYAYNRGVTVIASAADEAAQHHNWPSNYPRTIVVNSVTQYDETLTPQPRSYLQFNGCTNFSSKITVAIPSVSCSSDATGRGSGIAGLIYSAALNARAAGKLTSHSRCLRADGRRCVITPNEVQQLMASGSLGGAPAADDVSFASQPETSCTVARVPSCTDPNLNAPGNHAVVSPVAGTRRYPARAGHDQFYGYGRVNVNRAVDALSAGQVPPEVEITSPEWYAQIDPSRPTLAIRGAVWARGHTYSCRVYAAPGSSPNNRSDTDIPPGDFKVVGSTWCNGSGRSGRFKGVLGTLDLADLKARFPANAGDFSGREPGTGAQSSNGRPNSEPYGFTIKVVASSAADGAAVTGEDRRNLFLHRDADLLSGFPKQLRTDGESSPLFVDLNGDNRTELVLGTSDGVVHAFRRGGGELRGWPVRGDRLPLHTRGRAFARRAISTRYGGAIFTSPAAADLDRDGTPEVVAADFEGKVYVWNAQGRRILRREANPRFSGKPLRPFVDQRFVRDDPKTADRNESDESKRHRTQHGFIGSPVLADLDRNDGGRLEIVAAAMDRHVYAWNHDGSRVPGFPVPVVDRSKVASIRRTSHVVAFNANAGDALNQGAIVDTPAVGDIAGDGRPEIVVGTNEEYAADAPGEGGLNASSQNTASLGVIAQLDVLEFANGRLYALKPTGDRDGDFMEGAAPYLAGWPFKVGRLLAELLPVVGEGVTGAPIIGPVDCPEGGEGPKVGVIPDAGVGYVVNPTGDSCYGKDDGKDRGLQTDASAAPGKTDTPAFPAVGHPAFGNFAGGISFVAPAAGLLRALDLAVNEYQSGGQDFLAAWNAADGQFRPGFPSRVNDLQFLTGPSVADVDGAAGEEMVGGTASLDLAAMSGTGVPVNTAWPKLTSDWTVANPLIGSFGTRDTSDSARKVVAALTRSGSLFAYETDAPACSPGSWPRFHHDPANSGDYRRDAVSPGRPSSPKLEGRTLSVGAPGDDLLCGQASRYEIAHSNSRINGATFRSGKRIATTVAPAEPGTRQSIQLPTGLRRYVAIRAVDEQGNVGRVARVRR